ncbi:MAG: hypothetical protein EOO53_07270 [Gammaproteobacteria bacterium]|nr:MAG: hypothetical protein EOO53_07270 [Gammaproteobacteria bacterium]
MLPGYASRFLVLTSLSLSLLLTACTTTTEGFRSSCASESDTAWKELSLSKAKGFGGTVSYAKALGLLTAARPLQVAEKFEACYNNAHSAREYISNSYKGE